MKCEQCGRDGLSEKELSVHIKYYHAKQILLHEQPPRTVTEACPDCGSVLFYQEGCANCRCCGYSKCE